MIPLHERTLLVQKASSEVQADIWSTAQKHQLTYIETAQIVTAALSSVLKYALREERHPNEPDKRADEDNRRRLAPGTHAVQQTSMGREGEVYYKLIDGPLKGKTIVDYSIANALRKTK